MLRHRTEVLKLERANVFVFVDELSHMFEECKRAGSRGQDHQVLSSIVNLMSHSDKFTVVLSLLDNTVLYEHSTSFDIATVCMY